MAVESIEKIKLWKEIRETINANFLALDRLIESTASALIDSQEQSINGVMDALTSATGVPTALKRGTLTAATLDEIKQGILGPKGVVASELKAYWEFVKLQVAEADHTHSKDQVGLSNIPNAISGSVALNSNAHLATSAAVKTAYDKAIEAFNTSGYAFHRSTYGYYRNANSGLYVQWGLGKGYLPFPVAFPVACLGIAAGKQSSAGVGYENCYAQIHSRTTITLGHEKWGITHASNPNQQWIAIGH